MGRPASAAYAPSGASADPFLVRAVLDTLAYADIFAHPLTAEEVHNFLVATPATVGEVRSALRGSAKLRRSVECAGGLFMLAGRGENVALRQRREERAAAVWPKARRWARILAALPFVRLVAVTGALAVDAADPGSDIDYLIVATERRVWTCRAVVTALARAARLLGASLCPNYVLSEGALALEVRTLYTAHELLQMVPLAGGETWRRLCRANAWVSELLPNARWRPPSDVAWPTEGKAARVVQWLLSGRSGERLERLLARWQVSRLTRKMARGALPQGEADFAPDSYRGHFDAHGARILSAWRARVDGLTGVAG